MTRPEASSAATRSRMQRTRRRDTVCEKAVRSKAHRLGLRYRVDWPIPNTRRRADVAFVRARVLVFIDGCFWHGCPVHGTWPKANGEWWRRKIAANVRRDRDTDETLACAGWRVLRIWEHEDPGRAARRIARAVHSNSAKLARTGDG